MKTSIKANFIYNNLLTLSTLLFPLISFPYVSRILGPNGIGIYNYAFSVTNYFLLFASLGLPIYGIREIAKARASKGSLSKTFSELLSINICTTLVLSLLGLFILNHIDVFEETPSLKYLSVLFILSNIGNIDWLFKGMEDYGYITIRTIALRLITITLLFIFVKEPADYVAYYMLTVLSNVAISCFNIYTACRSTRPVFRNLSIRKHIKPLLLLFSTQLAMSIYVNLDTVMLGSLSTTTEVGFYTAAIKIVKVCLMIVTSLGVVMIPRLSLYFKEGKEIEAQELLGKSLLFIFLIGAPIFIGLLVINEPLIILFAGEDFSYASTLVRYLAPIILLIGLSNLFGLQVLVPLGKEKLLLISVLLGAVANFILNLSLIPTYHSQGAAIGTFFAELIVAASTIYFAYRWFPIIIPLRPIILYVSLSLVFIPISYTIGSFLYQSPILHIVVTVFVCAVFYLSGLLMARDSFVLENINFIKKINK